MYDILYIYIYRKILSQLASVGLRPNYIIYYIILYIPERTPHFGGLWEAAVRSLKKHLYRIVSSSLLRSAGQSCMRHLASKLGANNNVRQNPSLVQTPY